MSKSGKFLVSIVGPTAVGKTKFAISIAKRLGCEIISADSRQFYKELNIGTAKPSKEELLSIKHHLIDSLSIHDTYNAGMFEKEALFSLDSLFAESDFEVMVGGSGMYCKAVWEGLDVMPEIDKSVRNELNSQFKLKGLAALVKELEMSDPAYADLVDKKNPQRIIRALEIIRSTKKPYSEFRKRDRKEHRKFKNIKIGLELERDELYSRIDIRMDNMIDNGLFLEAKELSGFAHLNALQTVGYVEVFDFLNDKYDRDEAIRLLKRNSRRYAKRQLTWFKKDPDIVWITPSEEEKCLEIIANRSDRAIP